MSRDTTKYPDSSKKKKEVYDGGDEVWIGPLEVLRSNAGHFIGRMCWIKDGDLEYEDHYSRESGYYPSEDAARRELLGNCFEVRSCSENDFMYEQGIVPRPETST